MAFGPLFDSTARVPSYPTALIASTHDSISNAACPPFASNAPQEAVTADAYGTIDFRYDAGSPDAAACAKEGNDPIRKPPTLRIRPESRSGVPVSPSDRDRSRFSSMRSAARTTSLRFSATRSSASSPWASASDIATDEHPSRWATCMTLLMRSITCSVVSPSRSPSWCGCSSTSTRHGHAALSARSRNLSIFFAFHPFRREVVIWRPAKSNSSLAKPGRSSRSSSGLEPVSWARNALDESVISMWRPISPN